MDSNFSNQSGDFRSGPMFVTIRPPWLSWMLPDKVSCNRNSQRLQLNFIASPLQAEGWWNLSGRSLRTCLTPPEHTLSRPSTHKSTLKQTEETKLTRPWYNRQRQNAAAPPTNPHLIIRRLTDIRCADDWRQKNNWGWRQEGGWTAPPSKHKTN